MRRAIPTFLCFVLILSLSLALPPAQQADAAGTVYYVDSANGNDSNNGTSTATPWKTLSKVNNTTFQPGDRILFRAGGIWNGQLWPKGSGSAGMPIVIDQYRTGPKPIINGNGTSSPAKISGTVMLVEQDYWEINNLEITNYSSSVVSNRVGILAYTSQNDRYHLHFKNNYVHDVNSNPKGSKGTGGIIFVRDTDDIHTNGAGGMSPFGFHDVLVENNHVRNVSVEGIRTAGTANNKVNTDIVFRNNFIEEIQGDGIVLSGVGAGGLVEHNIVKNFANANVGNVNYAGIWNYYTTDAIFQYNEAFGGKYGYNDGEGYDIDLGNIRSLFQYNYSHGNRGGFALFMNGSQNSVFRYNVSVNDGAGTEIFFYGPTTAADAPDIYNNTIITGQSSQTKLFNSWSPNATMKFYNNLIYGGQDVTFANYAPLGSFSNNIVYPAAILETNAPASHPGLVTEDPKLSNPWTEATGIENTAVYKLRSGSPAINSGKSVSNNGGLDFFGNTLYNDLPDIGAHEYHNDQGPTPEPIPVTSITLNQSTLTLDKGSTYTLIETILPTTVYDKNVTWSTNNASVAKVSQRGVVTATGAGTAIITATSNADPSFSAQCIITVQDALVLYPSADAYVRDGSYATSNYGSDSSLPVKKDAAGYSRKAYVNFDIRPIASTNIQYAKLRFYVTAVNTASTRTIQIYNTATGWNETSITWNNAPVKGSTLIGSLTIPNTAANTWQEVDITSYLTAHQADGQLSFLLVNEGTAGSTTDVTFSSREGMFQPQLLVK